ncbi:hypothetical protein S7711_09451 [Stachybotrys chartarum IBT 7711]|uniref:Heterokaryon incompatibility domain-containing protein n=1 Tax=Stachybotrys chartarum (strain CBS 109288 / IBT 7711) TaxID=1280523 RepID=A0A084B8S6_STACB|nr:hypothetical protein S7711_09451 [Stachybotrys chartarum IBT 7711]
MNSPHWSRTIRMDLSQPRRFKWKQLLKISFLKPDNRVDCRRNDQGTALIDWPSSQEMMKNHDEFHLRGREDDDDMITVFDIGVLGRSGCAKCLITYESCVKVHRLSKRQQKQVKAFWNICYPIYHVSGLVRLSRNGVIHLFPYSLNLEPVQLYSLPASEPWPWNFVMSMQHLLESRHSKGDWEIESSQMGTIYRDAHLVLAASQACDPYAGLIDPIPACSREHINSANIHKPDSGIVSQIYARRVQPEIAYTADEIREDNLLRMPVFHDVRFTPLAQRAWTFQASLLARRIVYFTGAELLRECRHGSWCECAQRDQNPDVYDWSNKIIATSFLRPEDTRYAPRGTSNYPDWNRILRGFTVRSITYETDRLPALSGLAKYFQSLGAGQYLAGFWRRNLLDSLLWRTDRFIEGTNFERATPYRAPTWSFLSLTWSRGKQAFSTSRPPMDLNFHSLTKARAKVLDAGCTAAGRDETGLLRAGYVVIQ